MNIYNSVDIKTFEQHNPAIIKSLNKMEKFAQYGWVITAPQVGLPMKIMLVQLHLALDEDGFTIKGTDKTKNYIFANPEIRPLTNEKAFSIESSLSVPALSGVVERHQGLVKKCGCFCFKDLSFRTPAFFYRTIVFCTQLPRWQTVFLTVRENIISLF